MTNREPAGSNLGSDTHISLAPLLGVTAVLVVIYAGVCKALLFHNLEYQESDFFSFLEMSWSWHYAGRLLHDNVFGYDYAIHNYYLLLAFAPLTIPFGAYGLFLGLTILNVLAVLRVASASALDLSARFAVLAAFLSPIAYFVFDHPGWGFHPELCYPPLALLLALDLLDRRRGRAILVATLIVLVKEDGAVVLAAVLLAYFACRLWVLRKASRDERRREAAVALLSLLAASLVFVLGMAVLTIASRELASTQGTSTARILDALGKLSGTLTGSNRAGRGYRLQDSLTAYALIGVLTLVPLGKRIPRGLALLLLSSPPLLVVVLVSSASYRFTLMMWSPRIATLLALALACLVFASSMPPPTPTSRPAVRAASAVALVVVSWALQLALLARIDYTPWPRLNIWALLHERGYSLSRLPEEDVRFLRCVSDRLPGGLPVSVPGGAHPVFHRQSIMFDGCEAHAWHKPRLRFVPAAPVLAPDGGTPCRGPQAGGLVVEVECGLLPLVAECGREPEAHPTR